MAEKNEKGKEKLMKIPKITLKWEKEDPDPVGTVDFWPAESGPIIFIIRSYL